MTAPAPKPATAAATAAAEIATRTPGTPRLAVLPAKLTEAVGRELDAAIFDEAMLAAVQEAGYPAFGASDIDAVLDLERQRDLVGCAENACMIEIGGALDVDELIQVSVGRAGSGWAVAMKLISVRASPAVVEARLVETRSGDGRALLQALPSLTRRLLTSAGLTVSEGSQSAARRGTATRPTIDRSRAGARAAAFSLRNVNPNYSRSFVSLQLRDGAGAGAGAGGGPGAAARPGGTLILFFDRTSTAFAQALPFYDALRRTFAERGLEVIAVSLDTDADAAATLATSLPQMGLSLPVASDRFHVVAKRFGVEGSTYCGVLTDAKLQVVFEVPETAQDIRGEVGTAVASHLGLAALPDSLTALLRKEQR